MDTFEDSNYFRVRRDLDPEEVNEMQSEFIKYQCWKLKSKKCKDDDVMVCAMDTELTKNGRDNDDFEAVTFKNECAVCRANCDRRTYYIIAGLQYCNNIFLKEQLEEEAKQIRRKRYKLVPKIQMIKEHYNKYYNR